MILETIIKPDSVLCNVAARSKKHCLEIMSELLTRSHPDIASEEVFAKLIERERLGCTTLDKGIAFPHCRVAGLTHSSGALMKLIEPVDFDAIDGDPVDLVFGLMVPQDVAASNIAEIDVIADLSRDSLIRGKLKEATSSRDLYNILISGQDEQAVTARSAG
jgi:PTS system nitrogen regulatory IIA component